MAINVVYGDPSAAGELAFTGARGLALGQGANRAAAEAQAQQQQLFGNAMALAGMLGNQANARRAAELDERRMSQQWQLATMQMDQQAREAQLARDYGLQKMEREFELKNQSAGELARINQEQYGPGRPRDLFEQRQMLRRERVASARAILNDRRMTPQQKLEANKVLNDYYAVLNAPDLTDEEREAAMVQLDQRMGALAEAPNPDDIDTVIAQSISTQQFEGLNVPVYRDNSGNVRIVGGFDKLLVESMRQGKEGKGASEGTPTVTFPAKDVDAALAGAEKDLTEIARARVINGETDELVLPTEEEVLAAAEARLRRRQALTARLAGGSAAGSGQVEIANLLEALRRRQSEAEAAPGINYGSPGGMLQQLAVPGPSAPGPVVYPPGVQQPIAPGGTGVDVLDKLLRGLAPVQSAPPPIATMGIGGSPTGVAAPAATAPATGWAAAPATSRPSPVEPVMYRPSRPQYDPYDPANYLAEFYGPPPKKTPGSGSSGQGPSVNVDVRPAGNGNPGPSKATQAAALSRLGLQEVDAQARQVIGPAQVAKAEKAWSLIEKHSPGTAVQLRELEAKKERALQSGDIEGAKRAQAMQEQISGALAKSVGYGNWKEMILDAE